MIKKSFVYNVKSLSDDLKITNFYWSNWSEQKTLPINQFNPILQNIVRMIKDVEETEKEIGNITVPYLERASTYLKRFLTHTPREMEDLDVSIYLLKRQQENLLKILRKIDTSEKFVRGKKFYFKKILFFDNFGLTEDDWQNVAQGLIKSIMKFPMPMKKFLLETDFELTEKINDVVDYDHTHKIVKMGMDEAINISAHFDRLFIRGFLIKFWHEDFKNKQEWLEESESNNIDKFLGITMQWIANGVTNQMVLNTVQYFPI